MQNGPPVCLADLELSPATVPAVACDASTFTKEVADVLDYTIPDNPVRQLELAQALTEKNIMILPEESVKAYKHARKIEERGRHRRRVGTWVCLLGSLAAFTGSLYGAIASGGWLIAATIVAGLFLMGFLISFFQPRGTWISVPINDYKGLQPPFQVLEKAMIIKRAVPTAEIGVEYFDEHPDPFMTVTHGDQVVYFAVWDEENFKI